MRRACVHAGGGRYLLTSAWTSGTLRLAVLGVTGLGVAVAVAIGYSRYVTGGAVAAACMAALRLTAPRLLAPGPPGPELAMLLVPVSFIYSQDAISSGALPLYDQHLYLVDAWLGQPGFVMGRLFAAWPALRIPCTVAYQLVPLVLAGAYLTVERRGQFVAALLLSSAAGFGCYLLVPAAGPRFTFPTWPWHEPAIAQPEALFLPGVVPNCMPSLHLTWVLLAATYSRQRRVMAVFVLLTAGATLGLGEHYAVDLVAAAPFTIGVVWLVGRAARDLEAWRLRRPA